MASNAALVKRLLKAYTRGDLSAFASAVGPKFRWRQNVPTGYYPFARPQTTAAGVTAALQQLNAEFEFPKWKPVEFIEQGSVVWVLVEVVAIARKSKRKHAFEVAQRWKFRRGKIVDYVEFIDSASLLIAEGRIKPKG